MPQVWSLHVWKKKQDILLPRGLSAEVASSSLCMRLDSEVSFLVPSTWVLSSGPRSSLWLKIGVLQSRTLGRWLLSCFNWELRLSWLSVFSYPINEEKTVQEWSRSSSSQQLFRGDRDMKGILGSQISSLRKTGKCQGFQVEKAWPRLTF